jgi:hypothetical protein
MSSRSFLQSVGALAMGALLGLAVAGENRPANPEKPAAKMPTSDRDN